MRVLYTCLLIVIVALGIGVAAREAWVRCSLPDSERAPGREYLARFATIRPHLASVPAVAYLIDLGEFAELTQSTTDAGTASRRIRALLEYFTTQRALAPTMVRPAADDHWLLGNYRSAEQVPNDWRARGLDLAADAGNGVVLFERRGR